MRNVVIETLTGIYKQHGDLSAPLVVEEARDPASPIHDRFEWDDGVAAENYRLVQAAHLIRSVKVSVTRPDGVKLPTRIRAFMHTGDFEAEDAIGAIPSYVPREMIDQDPAMQKVVLARMKREWRELERRWGDYKEFWDIVNKARDDLAS